MRKPPCQDGRWLPDWCEAAWLVLFAALMAWRLLLPGFIGMADNGDFPKVAGRFCLVPDGDPRDRFVHASYLRREGACYNAHVPTSEILPAAVAVGLARATGHADRFDIRWMGLVHGVLLLVAFQSLLVVARPFSWPVRFLLAAAGFAVSAVLLAATVWIVASTPVWYRARARFNLVFIKILKGSPAPAADLAELGLAPGDARYTGLHAFVSGGPMEDPGWAGRFAARGGYRSVLGFYMRHPARTLARWIAVGAPGATCGCG